MGFTKPAESPQLLVGSYPTFSPLPAGIPAGGIFSVALSLALRPVDVIDHSVLRSPDFPLEPGRNLFPAIVFPAQKPVDCQVQ